MTVGQDTWITLTDADKYFQTKWGASAWLSLNNNQKESLLITAYNWINQQSFFSISPASTDRAVLQAQCEAAWFIYKFFDGYEERRALQEAGVKAFIISEFEEDFNNKQQFPKFISDILKDFTSSPNGGFALMTRELEY